MDVQRDLEGLGALVTGATSGIGKAAAEELGRHGAEVIVHGRDPVRGSLVVATIRAEGGTARFMAADLSDPSQLVDLAGRVGAVDVLVNNAGFSWFGPSAELDAGTFDRLFAVNVRAPYFLVAALAPKIVVPDHSPPGDGTLISEEKSLMNDLVTRTKALKGEGKSMDEVKHIVAAEIQAKYQGWTGLNRIEDAVGRAYTDTNNNAP